MMKYNYGGLKMNLYEGIVMVTFIMVTIMMISQYIDSEVPRLCDVLQLMNILPCYEIKAFKDGHRLYNNELIKYTNSFVKAYELKNGVLYIEIY